MNKEVWGFLESSGFCVRNTCIVVWMNYSIHIEPLLFSPRNLSLHMTMSDLRIYITNFQQVKGQLVMRNTERRKFIHVLIMYFLLKRKIKKSFGIFNMTKQCVGMSEIKT